MIISLFSGGSGLSSSPPWWYLPRPSKCYPLGLMGPPCPYYRTTSNKVFHHQLAITRDPVTERVEAGLIHPDAAKYMIPESLVDKVCLPSKQPCHGRERIRPWAPHTIFSASWGLCARVTMPSSSFSCRAWPWGQGLARHLPVYLWGCWRWWYCSDKRSDAIPMDEIYRRRVLPPTPLTSLPTFLTPWPTQAQKDWASLPGEEPKTFSSDLWMQPLTNSDCSAEVKTLWRSPVPTRWLKRCPRILIMRRTATLLW